MSAFEIVHQDDVQGKLVCFDRLIFKGHLMALYQPGGMAAFLESQDVKLVGWKTYVRKLTETLAAHVQGLAAAAERPYQYLPHNYTKATGHSKEETGPRHRRAGQDHHRAGLRLRGHGALRIVRCGRH